MRPPPPQASHEMYSPYFFCKFRFFFYHLDLRNVLFLFIFISLWRSSGTFCSVISGFCSIIVKIPNLMSLSFSAVSPWMRIKHLNISIERLRNFVGGVSEYVFMVPDNLTLILIFKIRV